MFKTFIYHKSYNYMIHEIIIILRNKDKYRNYNHHKIRINKRSRRISWSLLLIQNILYDIFLLFVDIEIKK